MSVQSYDTFDGGTGDLLGHIGQLGAHWSRHPSSVFVGGDNTWWLSGTGGAYTTVNHYLNAPQNNNHALYMVSGSPASADYDVAADVHFYSFPSDQAYGICLDLSPTANTCWRLVYRSFSKKWALEQVFDAVATTMGEYPDTPTLGTVRKVRIKRRAGTGTMRSFSVFFDGSGTAAITASDGLDAGDRRVGLYGSGSVPSGSASGIHYDALAIGSADFPLPDYGLTGPSATAPGATSDPYTVALASGVNPGAVTITPSVTGLTGTFTPTTVALSNTTRSATFRFIPGPSGGSGTVGVSDSGAMVDPPACELTSSYTDPVRLAFWESQIHWCHTTGPAPYMTGAGTFLDGPEHYDPIRCMMQARDYCVRKSLAPTDWSDQIAAGLERYRDYVIAAGSVQNHHINSTGMARHWYETGDPADKAGINVIFGPTGNLPQTAARYRVENSQLTTIRPSAFHLLASIDREWAGMGVHPWRDAACGCLLDNLAMLSAAPGTRYGVWNKVFMNALALQALITYWDRYRNSADSAVAALVAQIPAAVRTNLDYIWTTIWYPAGTAIAMGGGGTWDKGSIPYIVPAWNDPSLAPLTGFTVQAKLSSNVYTGPSTMSTVDGYYKGNLIRWDDIVDDMLIVDYVGSNRAITINPYYNPYSKSPGAGFSIRISPPGETDIYPVASPELNHMLAPAYAWMYWYIKVIQSDANAAIAYRVRHDAIFEGGTMCWGSVAVQKQWNQSLFWTTQGLDWRSRGDSEWPAATAATLQPPATGAAGPAAVESGPFRASIPHGVSLAAPAVITPSTSSGLGTFSPASGLVQLTTDRPWAPFTLTPDVADDNSVVDVQANLASLTEDAPVPYEVGDAPPPPPPPGGGRMYPIKLRPTGGLFLKARP